MRITKFSARNGGLGAFTLVEIMVVLGIIGLVMTLSLPLLIPLMRSGKLDNASDTVKSSCVLARSKAIQERRTFAVTLFQAERAVIITDYEDLRTAAGYPAQQPFCPHFLDNYSAATETEQSNARWENIKAKAVERIRYIPEGCRFAFDPDVNWPCWTYIFLPNGSAWSLPPSAQNSRSTWSIATYMLGGRPSGPHIYGPQDRESTTIVVYATTGQAMSE
jgi:type II secretory pathway pseudopilin PulG